MGKKIRLKPPLIVMLAAAGLMLASTAVKKVPDFISGIKGPSFKNTASSGDILEPVSFDKIRGNTYYVKEGDTCWILPSGYLSLSDSSEQAVAVSANPSTRLIMFGKDDASIPTLYSDTELIYKAERNKKAKKNDPEKYIAPTEFVMERYKDIGYSIGIHGLQSDGGKYNTTITDVSFYPGSSITSALKVNNGDQIVFDKIGGVNIDDKNVSSAGTILGLKQDTPYSVDAYTGTKFLGFTANADTHMYSSYELYTVKDFTMDESGYITIKMPSYMWSGYYFINGTGFVRYINHPKAEGDSGVEFNTPYYMGLDANGDMITNSADARSSTTSVQRVAASVDDMKWTMDIPVESDTEKELNVYLSYSDAQQFAGDKLIAAVITKENKDQYPEPSAVLVSPSGKTFKFSKSTSDPNLLSVYIDLPARGTWKVIATGMFSRTFKMTSNFDKEAAVNADVVIEKNDDKDATMNIHLDNDLTNGVFCFRWDNSNHAAKIYFTDNDRKNGRIFETQNVTEDSLNDELWSEAPENIAVIKPMQETYGLVAFPVKNLPAGNYRIYISGESLGHVYFNYTNDGKIPEAKIEGDSADAPAEESIPETAEESEESTEENGVAESIAEQIVSEN